MKKIIFIILLSFIFSSADAGIFSDKEKSKKTDDILSIEVAKGKWLFFPKDKLVLMLDENSKTVTMAYGNSEGEIASWWFKTPAEAKALINSIYPNAVCLTRSGLKTCESTGQLKIEEKKD